MTKPMDDTAIRAAIVLDADEHEAKGKGLIRLSSLPPNVSAKLAQYDTNGDGTLDWSEVFSAANGASSAACVRGLAVRTLALTRVCCPQPMRRQTRRPGSTAKLSSSSSSSGVQRLPPSLASSSASCRTPRTARG
jgi:hypothetical protein